MRTRTWYIAGAALAAVAAIGWLGAAIAQPDFTSPEDTGFQPPLNSEPIIPISIGPLTNLATCSLNATDIVVTDAEGRVLETWCGKLKPGEIVRLGPMWLTPANALPWEYLRLRPDRTLSSLYHLPRDGIIARRGYIDGENEIWDAICPETSETVFRLVLFLRKQGMTSFETVWMPAVTPPILLRSSAIRPMFQEDDFTTSIAWVEAGRVLMVNHNSTAAQMVRTARSLEDFRDEVLAQPFRPHSSAR